MTHPFDQRLRGSYLMRWLITAIVMVNRHWRVILPFAALATALSLVLDALGANDTRNRFVAFVASVFSGGAYTLIGGLCFYQLARREEQRFAVESELSHQGMPQRLLVVGLAWGAIGAAIGIILIELSEGFGSAFVPSSLRQGNIAASLVMAWLMVALAISVVVVLAVMSTLSGILAVRTREPIDQIIFESIKRVLKNPARIYIPIAILTLILAVGLFLILRTTGFFRLLQITSNLALGLQVLLVLWIFTLSLAMWFVLERAYLPETPGASPSSKAIGVTELTPPLMSKKQMLLSLLADTRQSGAAKADQIFEFLKGGALTWPEIREELQAHASDRLAVLKALAVRCFLADRLLIFAECLELGARIEAQFLQDQGDHAVAMARALIKLGKPDAALKLLSAHVRERQTRADHLDAGVLMVRLLMTHLNKPEAALKLLSSLQTLYPGDAQLAELNKILKPKP